jgi:hypothetical protein
MQAIKNIFIGGVYTDNFRDRDSGGPECESYMPWEFRVLVTSLMVNFSIKIGPFVSIYPKIPQKVSRE